MIEYNKELAVYLEKEESSLIKFINPRHFIKDAIANDKSIEDKYVINFLQDELRELLQSFLNGGFSSSGFIFYPALKDVSEENRNMLRGLAGIVDYLNEKDYDFSGSISSFKSHKPNSSKNFALILSSLYRDFGNTKKNNIKKAIKKRKCKAALISGYKDKEYVEPVFGLKNFAEKSLKDCLCGLYLHGSLSTRDYVKGWSDLDTLAVVNKKTANSYEGLLCLRDCLYKSRRFFHLIDPLQHHGHIILTEHDLDYYPESYFPSALFPYSKSLFDSDKIENITLRNDDIEKANVLFNFVNYFRGLYLGKRQEFGAYRTKFLLHAVTLFPTLYLQAKGLHVYKKYSFGIAKKDFGSEWKVIEEVEKIRRNWVLPKASFVKSYSRINPILAYQINAKYMDYFKNVKSMNKLSTKKIVEGMFRLSEEAWKKIKWKI